MTVSAPTSMGSFVSTANVTTSGALALSPGAGVGNLVFISVVGGSSSIGAGVTDTKGNTWTQISAATAASGAAGTATGFYSVITSALVAGTDTITVTRTPTGSLTAHIMLLTDVNPLSPLGNSGTTPTANSVTAVTAMPSGSITVNNGDIAFQVTMIGTGYGTITPNVSPAFTTFVTVDSTGGTNPRGTNVEYRQITAGATFTPQITTSAGKAYAAVAVVFAFVPPVVVSTVAAVADVPAVTVLTPSAGPAPATVAAVAAVPAATIVPPIPAPATVAAVAGVAAVTVSTFLHPTLVGIGDSTTYRSGSTSSPPSREATTRAVMVGGGFDSGGFYWYGVGGKSMTGTDSGGKTTTQNITDAVAVLGTPIDIGYVGLATNDVGSSDATFTADLNTVLDALEASVTRTYWINLAFYSALNTNAAHFNPIIATQIGLRTKVVYCDFNTYIHQIGVYDPLDWIFPTDSTHMTTQGWAKRDAYILAQLEGVPDPATVVATAAIPAPAAYRITAATVAAVAGVGTVVPSSSPTPATVAATAAVPTVVFSSAVAVAPATVAATAAVPAATVTLPATPAPATVAAVAGVGAPVVTGSVTLAPATVTGTAAIPAPAQVGSGVTPVRRWYGDGLTSGTTVTTSTVGTGDNAFTTVTGTITTDTVGPHPARLRYDQQAAATCVVQWGSLSGLAMTETAGRAYWQSPAVMPSTAQMLISMDGTSSATAWRVYVAGTGSSSHVRLYDKTATQVTESTSGLAASTYYRFEWQQTANTMTVYWYAGDSPTALDSVTYTATGQFNVTPQVLYFGYRVTSVTMGASYFDGMALANSAAALFGPIPDNLAILSTVAAVAAVPTATIGGVTVLPATVAAVAVVPGPVLHAIVAGFNDFDTVGRTAFDTVVNGSVEEAAAGYSGNGLNVSITNGVVRQRWSSDTFGTRMAYGAITFRFRFRTQLPQTSNLGGTDAAIMTTKSSTLAGGTGQGHFGMFFHPADNTLRWDLLAANAGTSTMTFTAGRWYYVQARFFYGGTGAPGSATYTADVRIDGIPQTSIASPSLDPYYVAAMGFGSDQTVQTYQYDVDDILFAASTDPVGFLGDWPPLTAATVAATAAVPAVGIRYGQTVPAGTVTGVAGIAPVVVSTASTAPVLVVAAVAAVPLVQVVTTAYDPPAPTGSWGTLLALLDEVRDIARQEATRTPSACPNDGEPLLSGPHGGLYCPWGDYQHGMSHPPGW